MAAELKSKLPGLFEDAGHGGHPEKLAELGGIEAVMKTLSVDTKGGLSDATVAKHKQEFGINALPERRFRGFHEFWMDALEDRVIVILIIAAIASLILGVTTHDPETGWIEGFAIFVAVLIVTLVSSFNDFSKDRKFRKLEAVKDDRKIKVLRNGAKCEISTYDLVAGDIMFLSTGDWIPADLCVLTAHSLAVDESAMTGEPDAIKKNNDTKPFCFSGTKVMEGEATCIVLAVGVSSQWGVLQMALRGKVKDDTNEKWPHNKRWLICPKYPEEEDDGTPLQQKLARLADQIGVFGLSVAVLIFLILLIKWGIGLALNEQLTKHKNFSSQAAGEVLNFFLTAVTILVVAVPEGLPLAVTIALAYSQRKMMKDNNLVRVLAACFDPRQPVIMANGEVRAIADVRVGDELVGDDGTARRVLGAWTGEAPMYEVAYGARGGADDSARDSTIVVTGAHQLVMYVKSSGHTHEHVEGRNQDGKHPYVAVDYSVLEMDEELGFMVPNTRKRKEFHYSSTCFMMCDDPVEASRVAAAAFAVANDGLLRKMSSAHCWTVFAKPAPGSDKKLGPTIKSFHWFQAIRQCWNTAAAAEAAAAAFAAAQDLLIWEPTVEQYLQFADKYPARARETYMRRAKVDVLPSAKLAAPTFTQLLSEACDETGVVASAVQAADVAWLVGCWLGDGKYQQPTITMASADECEASNAVFAKIQRVAAGLGLGVRVYEVAMRVPRTFARHWHVQVTNGVQAGEVVRDGPASASGLKRKFGVDGVNENNNSTNPFSVLLGKLGVFGDKSKMLSESAQLAFVLDSASVRGAMLAGLVDSDGSFHGTRWQITQKADSDASTYSHTTIIDVAFRCLLSLGMHATRSVVPTSGAFAAPGNLRWLLEFSVPASARTDVISPMVQTPHKRFDWSNVTADARPGVSACGEQLYSIVVRAAASVEFCGLKVDGNKRFLLGDYIVAHNCETMGGATQITTDKTGTLTQNRMTVVKGYVGDKFNEDSKAFADNCKDAARRRFSENISVNSTAFISRKKPDSEPELVGSKTECALLLLGEEMSIEYEKLRDAYKNNIAHLYPFASAKKTSGVVLSKLADVSGGEAKKKSKKNKEAAEAAGGDGPKFVYYVKGASEIVLLQCDRIESPDGSAPIPIDKKKRAALDQMIIDMASSGLRTLCLGYIELNEARKWEEERPESGMVLQCIVGIKDPVRKEVPAAVKDCQDAGVKVRMVTGDNVLTASHIGRECGILSEKGVAMIGPDFRKLSNAQLDPLLSGERQLEVIARCSPLDKQRLVSRLQKLGEVVASTGDGTNDAPQLKMADVGFAMGIAGTEVAKEACDIILMDDNFSSVVKALIWGRNVFDSIRKFLQFQLTVNVGALIVAVIGALGVGESPLTAVQLLWVNLIMDTMAALALATELPSRQLLLRKPYGRYEALITTRMWRFILCHASYQVVILLVLLFEMRNMFFFHDVDPGRPLLSGLPQNLYPWCLDEGSLCADLDMPRQDTTIIFNTFVLMQVFNEFNARFLNDEINIFAGIFTNHIFWIVIVITLGLQGIIVEFGWRFTQTAHLNGLMWAGCFVIGVSEIPYGLLLRFIPVPEVCCIKALARTEPVDNSSDDEAGPGLDFEPQPEGAELKPVDAAAKPAADAKPAAAAAAGDGTAGQKRLKPESHWRKAQEIHTTVSVVNAFRRSGRNKQ